MKLPSLLLLTLLLAVACVPLSGPISMEVDSAPVLVEEVAPAQPASVSPELFPTSGYASVEISDVEIEMGVGSPLPVFISIGGALPDSCAQVELIEMAQDGSKFIVHLGTRPSTDEHCIQDTIPFRMRLPLSVVDLPGGEYTVDVNGSTADFKLDTGESTADLRTLEMPVLKDEMLVNDVTVDIGIGSPIPVHAVISASLPSACAQLGEIQVKRAETTFHVRLTALVPAMTDCPQDTLPVKLEIPLNMVNLPDGPYTVIVNGQPATFEMP